MSDLETIGKSATSIKSILVTLTAFFTVTGTIVAGYGYLDNKFAKTEAVEKLEDRMTVQELKTTLRIAVEELYFLKAQLRKYPDDVELKDKVDDAQEYVDNIKELIKEKTRANGPQIVPQ